MAISGVYLGLYEGTGSITVPISGQEGDVFAFFVQAQNLAQQWLSLMVNGIGPWPPTATGFYSWFFAHSLAMTGGQPTSLTVETTPLSQETIYLWLWRIRLDGSSRTTALHLPNTENFSTSTWTMPGVSGGAEGNASVVMVMASSGTDAFGNLYEVVVGSPSSWSRRDRRVVYGLSITGAPVWADTVTCFDRITGPGATVPQQNVTATGWEGYGRYYYDVRQFVFSPVGGPADTVDGTLITDGSSGGGTGGGVGTGGGENLMRAGGVSVGQCLATGGVGTGGGENLMRAGGVSPPTGGCL